MNRQAINWSVRSDSANESRLTNQLKRKKSVQSESCVLSIDAVSGFTQDFSSVPVRLNSLSVGMTGLQGVILAF